MAEKETISLSTGSLSMIFEGQEVTSPVFQVLGVKKLSSQGSERYRVLLSDGDTVTSFTMLATQLNEMVNNNKLIDNTIIKIVRYALSNANNAGKAKKIMVILELEILKTGSEVGGRIGNPHPAEKVQGGGPENDVKQAPPSPMIAGVKRNASDISPSRAGSPQRRRRLNDSIAGGESITCTPIGALSPFSNRWTIKAKVMNKSVIRQWNNSRSKGKVFSFVAVDPSGDIRLTVFTDFVDKFYDMLENGKVYYISRGNVKSANKDYNSTTHEYEVVINSDTEIMVCNDAIDLPPTSYSFKKISELTDIPVTDSFDVIGVTYQTGNADTFVAKSSGRELTKRNIDLLDDSQTMITLTIWGDEATRFDGTNNPVIALKGVKIKEFNGSKYLTITASTMMEVDPDLPEAHRLRGWFSNDCPKNVTFQSLSAQQSGFGSSNKWLPLAKAYDKILKSDGNEKVIFKTKAFVSGFRSDKAIYKSCVDVNCKKKVKETGNGFYECEKCGTQSASFKYRMFMNISLSDDNYTMWVSVNDIGEEILGTTTDDLGALLDQNYRDEYNDVFTNSTFKEYIFTIKVNQEIYMDEKRVRGNILALEKVNTAKETKRLLDSIRKRVNKRLELNKPLKCAQAV